VVSWRLTRDRRSLQAAGLVALAVGLLALAAAAPTHSLPVLLAGALVTGAGHGLALLAVAALAAAAWQTGLAIAPCRLISSHLVR